MTNIDEKRPMKPIPDAVLDLLRTAHDPVDPNYYSFTHWEESAERRHDPSGYVYRASDHGSDHDNYFRAEQIKALAATDLFSQVTLTSPGAIVINEHAQHALQDFCSEVYSAWVKLNERIEMVASTPRRMA